MKHLESVACTVVSYGDSSNGTDKSYLRIVDADGEVTLPLGKATSKHRNFILSTWVKSHLPALRKTATQTGTVDLERLVQQESTAAENLWGTGRVVHGPEDDYTVYAWIVGECGRLDYIYVVPELRRKGVARALIAHVCNSGYEYGRHWPYKEIPCGGKFNPYVLRPGV